jgi:(1->4)-alpha-D-glucan 1-alpha-D-glucosylmutase
VAFGRGSAAVDGGAPQVVVVATRLAASLERLGGWGQHSVVLPEVVRPDGSAGGWRDVITGARTPGGSVPLASLLQTVPVALLVRDLGEDAAP